MAWPDGMDDGINVASRLEMRGFHDLLRRAAFIFQRGPSKAVEWREGMPVSLTVSAGARGFERGSALVCGRWLSIGWGFDTSPQGVSWRSVMRGFLVSPGA